MANSKIEWTDKTWNPVTGCTKVSQGCKHCYAERIAMRMWATQYPPNADGSPRRFTDVRLHPDRLKDPLRWTKPCMVFVNSMSDLFHDDIPDSFIDQVFAVMALCPQHTFQALTKRAERMLAYLTTPHRFESIEAAADQILRQVAGVGAFLSTKNWPLPNVWLGVSCEDQATADARIHLLLKTPAAIRFVSAEPLLGPIDLVRAVNQLDWLDPASLKPGGINWVIVGGESGAGARPMHPAWARALRDQCHTSGVAFFFKQGSQADWSNFKVFESFPTDLQIREYPIRKNS